MTGKSARKCWLSTNQLNKLICLLQTFLSTTNDVKSSMVLKGMYYPVWNEDDNESSMIIRVPIRSAQIRFDGCMKIIAARCPERCLWDLPWVPWRCSPVHWFTVPLKRPQTENGTEEVIGHPNRSFSETSTGCLGPRVYHHVPRLYYIFGWRALQDFPQNSFAEPLRIISGALPANGLRLGLSQGSVFCTPLKM